MNNFSVTDNPDDRQTLLRQWSCSLTTAAAVVRCRALHDPLTVGPLIEHAMHSAQQLAALARVVTGADR